MWSFRERCGRKCGHTKNLSLRTLRLLYVIVLSYARTPSKSVGVRGRGVSGVIDYVSGTGSYIHTL